MIVDLDATIAELAPRVLRYARARLGDPALAEDVVFTESGVTVREALDLWDMPLVFLVLAALLGGEWALRRSRGLA